MLIMTLLAFVTVFLLVVALLSPAQSTIQERLKAYGYAGDRMPGGDLSQPFARRVIWPAITWAAGLVGALLPARSWEQTAQKITEAGLGGKTSTGAFMLLRTVLALAVPAVVVVPGVLAGKALGLTELGIAALGLLIGWKLPATWLNLKIDGRRHAIRTSLPDALDLIVVCAEAGNSLEAAIARVAEQREGPLSDELNRTLREISYGKPRREALRDLAKRSGVDDLQSFVAAIVQADQMGVSIANTLRTQADAMRVRRRQRAEEEAAKAPVKMLLPLATMIFPALFVVVLGPAGIQIMQMFGGMMR